MLQFCLRDRRGISKTPGRQEGAHLLPSWQASMSPKSITTSCIISFISAEREAERMY